VAGTVPSADATCTGELDALAIPTANAAPVNAHTATAMTPKRLISDFKKFASRLATHATTLLYYWTNSVTQLTRQTRHTLTRPRPHFALGTGGQGVDMLIQ